MRTDEMQTVGMRTDVMQTVGMQTVGGKSGFMKSALKRSLATALAAVVTAVALASAAVAAGDEKSTADVLTDADYAMFAQQMLEDMAESNGTFFEDDNGDLWYTTPIGDESAGNAQTSDKHKLGFFKTKEGEFIKYNGEYMTEDEAYELFWADPANKGKSLKLYKGEWISRDEYDFLSEQDEALAKEAEERVKRKNDIKSRAKVNFSDVDTVDWFFPYLLELAPKGFVKGYADETFRPENPLLVDEFLAMTLRAMDLDQDASEDYWAANFITEAKNQGLIVDGDFAAYDKPITRGQIARIIARAVEYRNKAKTADASQDASQDGSQDASQKTVGTAYGSDGFAFSDIAGCADESFIVKAIDDGIIAGYRDRTFKPDNGATRAEAAVMVTRLIDESFRLTRCGGVFYCERTDLDEDGRVKPEKLIDFLYEATRTMRFEIDENGYAIMKGEMPQVPEGHTLVLEVEAEVSINGYYASASTDGEAEVTLPSEGKYLYELDSKQEAVDVINVYFNIIKGDMSDYSSLNSNEIAFSREYLTIHEASKDKLTVNISKERSDTDLSFCDVIWGW